MSPSADTESLEDLTEEMEFEQQNDSAYDSFTSGEYYYSTTKGFVIMISL